LRSSHGTEEVDPLKVEVKAKGSRTSLQILNLNLNLNLFLSYRGYGIMSQLGKRYRCQACGTEILCTKAGEGAPVCCDKEMEVQEPKPLPSSD
jgi:hypothetical protein